jgi:hypothetical protein
LVIHEAADHLHVEHAGGHGVSTLGDLGEQRVAPGTFLSTADA